MIISICLGRYTFSLSDEIRQGAFHPLRELEETEQEEAQEQELKPLRKKPSRSLSSSPITFLADKMSMGILSAIFVILPESHHEDDFLSVVFRSINTQGPLFVLSAPEAASDVSQESA